MKKLILFALVLSAATFTACTDDLYPALDERLTAIPAKPHNKEVEVYFAGEWPKEEYVKLAALEAHGGSGTHYITLINQLKKKGQSVGADALVVQGKNFITDVYSTADRMVTTDPISFVTGIAIKYVRNLDLGLMPKQQQLELYDPATATFDPILNLRLGIGGDIIGKEELKENASRFYNTYMHEYTEHHLLREEGAGWTELRQEGFVTERKLHHNGIQQKYLRFRYSPQLQLQQVFIEKSGRTPEMVQYTYNEAGKVVSREISRGQKPYLLEEYSYGEDGKVSEMTLYITTKNGREPLLRSSYTYYTLEEIR